ncbi:MAG: radical SAM protein, partial [Candidatus Sigynarchaeota archaeon]
LAKYLKKTCPTRKIVMGGPWATIEHRVIVAKGTADIVVRCEGEITIVKLADALENDSDLSRVEGITFKNHAGELIVTPDRAFIDDLDALPFPAWELFPRSEKYRFLHRAMPFFPIMTSRGCPFDCIHCTKAVHGYKFRPRSVENVIAELRYLKEKFRAREIFIIDDIFNNDLARAERILDEIIKNDFGFHIKFSNGIRADKLPRRLVKKLKRAGTYTVMLGIESGNQKIVNSIGKGLNLDKVKAATKLLKEEGIITGGFFMLGHPQDSKATMLETIAFAKSLDLDYPIFFKAVPFPGTKMFDIVMKRGKMVGGHQQRVVDKYTLKQASFEMDGFTAKDVENAFTLAYRLFYLRPRKILQLIAQFRSITELAWVIDTILKVFIKNL